VFIATVVSNGVSNAKAGLKLLQRRFDDGIPSPDATLTVSQFINSWNADVPRHQVAQGASVIYKRIFDHHIIPTLGRKRLANLSAADVDR
jgi:hypothetical protein